MKTLEVGDRSRREWFAVAVVTVLGAAMRLWPVGQLGLTHFDEGIYASVAGWSYQVRGLAGIDPTLIPYAPPGYPILGGLAYSWLGRSDGAMIAVSQLLGTLTIPVVAWLARRTFGPGSGFAASVFCAFSGSQIAFSRMALTDASFLIVWLVSLGLGMRFLEKPGVFRAVAMGLGVGLAQQFKYNGWLSGGIVIASAIAGIVVQPENRKAGLILRVFGWGGLAAVVAGVVVWPWYRFVESHGGYAALLHHQQSYLGGWQDWWPHFQIQADQAMALLGDRGWLWLVSLILVCLTPWVGRTSLRIEATARWSALRLALLMPLLAAILGGASGIFVLAPYWLGLVMAPWLLTSSRPATRLVGTNWLVMTLITPFYHPYARLWLPCHATNWLLMAGLVAQGLPLTQAMLPSRAISDEDRGRHRRAFLPRYLLTVGLFIVGFGLFLVTLSRKAQPQPDLLDRSDSLYLASMQVSRSLPEQVQVLQVLVRPPVLYYLAHRVTMARIAHSREILDGGLPGGWVLLDTAILRSELGQTSGVSDRTLVDRFATNWEISREFPTTLSLPTALDLDPGLARTSNADRSCPLWLLRPRRKATP